MHRRLIHRLAPWSLAVAMLLVCQCGGKGGGTPRFVLHTTASDSSLNPQQMLGKQLFEDTTLSVPPGVSCASCHSPSRAFTGNNGSPIAGVALGSTPGSFGTRKAPTLMYASLSLPFGFYPIVDADSAAAPGALNPFGGQFWDGRAATLHDQVSGPLLNPKEMNNADRASVIAKVRVAPYAGLFQSVCGKNIFDDADAAFYCLSNSIAVFEESKVFQPFSSKFDAYLRGKAQLSAIEARGFALFKDPTKGNCLSCHVANVSSPYPIDWAFTDHGYDSIGVPRNPAIPANADPGFFDLGLCQRPGLAAIAPPGFDIQTLCTSFKTPSLRNVALVAPYGHNGYFETLKDVVSFYATRDTNPDLWYPKATDGHVIKFNDSPVEYQRYINTLVPFDLKPGDTPHLSDSDVDAIVAFLNTLTDGYSN